VSHIFDPSIILDNIKDLFNQLDMEVMDLAINNSPKGCHIGKV